MRINPAQCRVDELTIWHHETDKPGCLGSQARSSNSSPNKLSDGFNL